MSSSVWKQKIIVKSRRPGEEVKCMNSFCGKTFIDETKMKKHYKRVHILGLKG